jgi:hypothetical protein
MGFREPQNRLTLMSIVFIVVIVYSKPSTMSTKKTTSLQKPIPVKSGIVLFSYGNDNISHYLFVIQTEIAIPNLISEHLKMFLCHSVYIIWLVVKCQINIEKFWCYFY